MVSADEYCRQINGLKEALPDYRYAINICRERYNFQRSMAAVIAAGQCNLLPPNRQSATIGTLLKDYPDSYVIHDADDTEVPDYHHVLDFRQLSASLSADRKLSPISPLIDDAQLAAVSFTSGSTGKSKPNNKTWGMLRLGNQINSENMLIGAPPGLQMLATVPPQHMYGLELSVLLPMGADVCVHSGQPLFAFDVQQALLQMPEPRCLVSTPQHLKVLLGSGLDFPRLERIFSATAPLDKALAGRIEQCFSTQLIEIYGCSEVGSIARRRTTTDENWTPFSAMHIQGVDDVASVKADHINEEYVLQDNVVVQPDGTFSLHGRLSDQINIAGKRGSLNQINHCLLAIPGVDDGVVFDPDVEPENDKPKRLAALVVAKDLDKQRLLAGLRENLDPVFLPRPIVFVDSLPRNETGKLSRPELLALFNEAR